MAYDSTDFQLVRLLDRDPKTIIDPKERLMYLRDFLRELPPERFDVNQFYQRIDGGPEPETSADVSIQNCGTAACIAGWAVTLFSEPMAIPQAPTGGGEVIEYRARELLGISARGSLHLFYPWMAGADDPTPNQAANVIDHLIQTDKVDWSKA